jgi:hypothetical protein
MRRGGDQLGKRDRLQPAVAEAVEDLRECGKGAFGSTGRTLGVVQ